MSEVKKLIMIVEDSHHDYDLLKRAIDKTGFDCDVIRFESGDDAIAYLQNSNNNNDEQPQPDFIFLDLNMPGLDGRDVLKKIKENDNISKIPVAILTSSEKESDIEKCYELGANTFIPKPMGLDNFIITVESIKAFWFDEVLNENSI